MALRANTEFEYACLSHCGDRQEPQHWQCSSGKAPVPCGCLPSALGLLQPVFTALLSARPVPAQCRKPCWPWAALSSPALRSPGAHQCGVWGSTDEPPNKLHFWEHCRDNRNWNLSVGFACVVTSTEVTVLRVNTIPG